MVRGEVELREVERDEKVQKGEIGEGEVGTPEQDPATVDTPSQIKGSSLASNSLAKARWKKLKGGLSEVVEKYREEDKKRWRRTSKQLLYLTYTSIATVNPFSAACILDRDHLLIDDRKKGSCSRY